MGPRMNPKWALWDRCLWDLIQAVLLGLLVLVLFITRPTSAILEGAAPVATVTHAFRARLRSAAIRKSTSLGTARADGRAPRGPNTVRGLG